HTRFSRDWSSDVCSSDLREPANSMNSLLFDQRKFFIKRVIGVPGDRVRIEAGQVLVNGVALDQGFITDRALFEVEPQDFPRVLRSEERRVGKECRARLSR